VRSSTEQRELRRAISEFDRELVTISEQLAEPELNDARLDDPAADMVEIGARLAAAEAHEHTVSERAGALRERRTDAEHRAGEVERALATATATLRSTAAAIRLGLLAAGNGDNQLRMDLTTFVLIRRFGEVIAAANEQLRRISSGRYQLEHTDARSGNARSGLGLLVLDLQTGRSRDPATLSGGETFYVSLSLALGLADVVRAESGGVDLGTLFIDEGFGSLDPEVLDEVLGALDSLRAGGRSVGLVSHVSELKVRIGDRIAVRRLPDGSSHLQLTA
jgi:exonuclease SbcC